MLLVLAVAALFVYARLKDDVDDRLADELHARAVAVAGAGAAAGAAGDPDESFAQIIGADGRVIDAAGGVTGPVRATGDVRIDGIDGIARVAAFRDGANRIVVGESLEDRDEVLADLVAAFAVGGPIAVALASLLGYFLAGRGLKPVEAMRCRAAEVSIDERLPLPEARDEIRRLGETLNTMLDRLQRSFERERRFVADAGHELRTPIAVIRAELENAIREGEDSAALRAALAECDHLAQLAEDLMIVARTADQRLPLHLETIDARELLEGVRARFADRGRAIHVAADPDVRFTADRLRLRQALGNLVDNALRHGSGDITLTARDGALEVSDEGAGFSPDIADRAFDRFARGDGARTGPGTGLGLSIVQAIAEAHGGSASIVPAGRATVRIALPLSPTSGRPSTVAR
jgi:two-component system, OmpR family, sensor kinase